MSDPTTLLAVVLCIVLGLLLVVVGAGGVLIWRYLDHRQRVERRLAGMPELPREPKKRPEPEPIPDEIESLIDGFESEASKAVLRTDVRLLRQEDYGWEQIERMLRKRLEL